MKIAKKLMVFLVMGLLFGTSTSIVHASENSVQENDGFSWDNATVYFAITDRFCNGNSENDNSYGRSVGEIDAENYQIRIGTFHGGDLKGLTEKIKEGYFDKLGVNAIWVTAPYEQMHGAICGDGFKHYAYHGYYPLDFTSMDKNMGTEEEMREFVNTAHQHNIRVVMDIVMNHVGYADAVTVQEYGFGELSEDWKKIYYETPESEYNWSLDYDTLSNTGQGIIKYDADWTNWWGTDWVRAVSGRYKGYEGSENADNYTLCLGGLPDIKTESNMDNGIPPILKTKWEKEGRLENESTELDKFFEESGLSRNNVNYIIKWLTDWVREYGIDGFRCDSVKHIEMEHWGTLKEQADRALKEWRKENPEDIASAWDEDFWMVGENFDFTNKKDSHFTVGKFDAMINLQFQQYSYTANSGLDYTYSEYAEKLQNNTDFNMLSYISSHDMGLGNRGMSGGTALLLCPGAVQIYYGDETGRTTNGITGEQGWRTQMNWDSIDEKILEHYQKIGTFRKKHPAIASGTHKMISYTPYTFSRISKKYDDKVVIAVTEEAGTYDILVSDVFSEGEWVKDAYSGNEYQVCAGMVKVETKENEVVLLEGTGKISASIGAKLLSNSLPFNTETISVKLYTNKLEEASYSLNGGLSYTNFKDGKVLNFGGGTAYGEVVSLSLKGIDENGNLVQKKYDYPRADEINNKKFSISVLKSEFEKSPFCYIYTENGTYKNAYPGVEMESDGEYWTIATDDLEEAYVILSQDEWRSSEDAQPGILITGNKLYSRENNSVQDLPSRKYGYVWISYKDEEGNILKKIYRKGIVGSRYIVGSAYIYGYYITGMPSEETGVFKEEDINIEYKYRRNNEIVLPEITKCPTISVTISPTASPTGKPTNTPIVEPTASPTGKPTNTPTMKPVATEPVKFSCTISNKKIKLESLNKKVKYNVYTKKFSIKATGNNVYYQIVKNKKSLSKKGWKKLNGSVCLKSNMKACVYIKYKDNDGKFITKKTNGFILDKTAPTVKIKRNKLYVSDNLSGIKKITDNGKIIKNKSALKKGVHRIVAIDKAGNKKNKKIRIK